MCVRFALSASADAQPETSPDHRAHSIEDQAGVSRGASPEAVVTMAALPWSAAQAATTGRARLHRVIDSLLDQWSLIAGMAGL